MKIEQAIESIKIGMINYQEHGGWRFSQINHVALDAALSALTQAQRERDELKNQIDSGELVRVVHGEWIVETRYATKTKYACSECGRTIVANLVNPHAKFPFCHCGAKMDGKPKE